MLVEKNNVNIGATNGDCDNVARDDERLQNC